MKIEFPNDFLWGSATSAHQVEGGNIWNDWYLFEKEGRTRTKEVSGPACDHYNRFKEDFDIAKSLNQNAHRLSIEWSRIEKEKGVFDQKEIEHYKKVLKYIKDNGFKTFVTLHHFTNPIWFAKEGGWENPKSIEYFLKFTKLCIGEFSEYIDFWTTLNEPSLYAFHAFLLGDRPPMKKSVRSTLRVFENLAEAHREAYVLIHKKIKNAQVGIANNFICYGIPYIPYIPVINPLLNVVGHYWNFYFLRKIKGYQDYIGVNYYTSTRLMQFDFMKRRKADCDTNAAQKDGWKIYPEGIYYVLMRTWHRYKKPMYITENGVPDRHDKVRKYYISSHLYYIHCAMRKKADIRGYFHWSLLDNFEWDYGYPPKFGLVEVDFETQERKIRESAKYYAEICETNIVEERYRLKDVARY